MPTEFKEAMILDGNKFELVDRKDLREP